MDVDKAGREGHAGAVDGLKGVAAGAIADQGDASLISCDIRHKRRPAVPVIHLGMRENRV